MFKFLNKIANTTTKSINSIGIDSESIEKAKQKTQVRDEKRHETSENLYKEAIELIKRFDLENKDELLRQAALRLDSSLKYNNHHAESYFWLAYIFFIFAKYKESIQYLKKAEELKPDYSKIKQLKVLLGEVRV